MATETERVLALNQELQVMRSKLKEEKQSELISRVNPYLGEKDKGWLACNRAIRTL